MKKVIMWLTLIMSVVLFVGCGSTTPNVPLKKMSEKFRFNKITFNFIQVHTPEIKYQTSQELEQHLNKQIVSLMNEKALLSQDGSMNTLLIDISYHRVFVGEDTPFPTDSLGSPKLEFTIKVLDSNETIRKIEKKNLFYDGGFFTNLGGMAGMNRNNDYENKAADALAKEIVDRVEGLR